MNEFILPMKKREKIAGWIYLPIHAVLMSLIILPAIAVLLQQSGREVTAITLNVIYYVTGFAFVLLFMFSYLRESFTSAWRRGPFPTVLIGFAIFYACNIIVNLILSGMGQDLVNPNQEAVNDAVVMSATTMFAVAVIMAPIVEEVLFRGVVFGTIRMKSRVFAYIISALLFAVYHLWASVIAYSDWTILIYLVQYIPAGLVLAWVYERCGSIWASILLHMAVNAMSVAASSMIN